MKKRTVFITLGYFAVYLVIYLTGRVLWCDMGDGNLIEWLFITMPVGKHSYLYGWLLSSNLFLTAHALSVLSSLWEKFRFSAVTTAGFIVGIGAGMIWGPNPAGDSIGHGHYGWAIWAVIYLISIAAGIILEKCKK